MSRNNIRSRRRMVRRLLWNGIESLEARQMLASDWSNVLQPLNVKGDEAQTVTPLDVLLVINEINAPKIRDSTESPLPILGANGKSPPPYVDVDCDNFVTPLDVLRIINAINSKDFRPSWRFSQNGGGPDAGSVTPSACSPKLLEGSSFTTSLFSDIEIPSDANLLSFEYTSLSFDTSSQGRAHDAFEAALLDSTGRSLVPTLGAGRDAFFNVTEGLPVVNTSSVTINANKVSLSLVDVLPGTKAQLVLRLVNNDGDKTTSVVVPSIRFERGAPLRSSSSPQAVPPPSGNPSTTGGSLFDNSNGQGASMPGEAVSPGPNVVVGRPVTEASSNGPNPNSASKPPTVPVNPALQSLRDPPGLINNRGKEFWVGFPDNLFEGNNRPQKALYITGDVATTGVVDIPGLIDPATSLPFHKDFIVNPGVVTVVELPSLDVGDNTDNETDFDVEVELIAKVQRKGIHVVTQEPVTVYGLDLAVSTSDAFLALPVTSLGKEYINLGYENTYASIAHVEGTQFLVVAAEDNTQVTLPPGQYSGATTASNATIKRPNGTTEFNLGNTDGRDIGPFVTDAAGTGSLAVSPPFDGYSGTYKFELIDVATAAVPANFDDKITVTFPTGRESKVLSFDVVAGQFLYYDAINPSPVPSVSVRILSPNGEIAHLDSQTDNNSFVNLFGALQFRETGKYYVLIAGEHTASFDFSFRLVNMESAPKISFGQTLSGTFDPAGRAEIYRIDGSVGQAVFFDALNQDRNVGFSVFGPGGQQVFTTTASDDRAFVLPETSTYVIVVESASFRPSSFGFQLIDLKSQPAIPLSMATSVNFSEGRRVAYRFAGSATQTFNLDIQSTSNPFRTTYSLRDAAGNEVIGIGTLLGGNTQSIKLITTGEYYLLVGGVSVGDVGAVTLTARVVDDLVVSKSGFDTIQTLSISPGGSASYQFSAPAGTRILVDGLNIDTANLYVELQAPDGTRLFTGFGFANDRQDIPRYGPGFLTQSGTYTVTVRGNTATDAGNYRFRVLDLDTFGTPMALGTLINGNFATGPEAALYTFNAMADDKLLFDGRSGGFIFGIYDEALNSIYGRGIFGAASVNEVDGIARVLRSGRHYALFQGDPSVSQDFSFAIENLSLAPLLAIGAEAVGTVPANGQFTYRMQLAAGQRIRLDNLLPYATEVNYRIANSGGRVLFESGFQNTDSGPPGNQLIIVPESGEYFVSIQSRQAIPRNFQFRIDDLALVPLLAFDADLEVTLNPSNAAQVFRIEANAGETIRLDNFGSFLPLNWDISGPTTQFRGGSNDGSDFSAQILNSGTYFFTISGRQNSGPINIRFRATRTPGPVVPLTGFNTTVNLDVGIYETKTHSFRAPTGRLVYLNVLKSDFKLPTHTVTLNQGESYMLRDLSDRGFATGPDLTGSIITSTKPVAVFGGNRATFIPSEHFAADHLVEQLPPTNTWGREFATMPLVTGSTRGDRFRFLAQADNTQVTVNGTVVATLNRGQFFEQVVVGPGHIVSTKPILVAQYAHSQNYYRTDPGANPTFQGDPLMMIVPPFEQFLASYTVSTPVASSILNAQRFDRNYINIVAPAEAVGLIEVDGVAIDASKFVAIGTSGFFGAQVAISLGGYQLAGPLPFGVFVYGFGSFDSYGYVGGQALSPVVTVSSVVLTPATANPEIGNSFSLAARVADISGTPLQGIRVDFDVAGVNPQRGFGFSDANGLVQFNYLGAKAGRDIVTASVGQLLDDSIIDWRAGAIAPQVIVAAPLNGSSVAAGTTLVATGIAIADFPLATLDLVTVNGVPLTSVDAAGNFFVQLFVGPGENEFEFAAIDSNGNTGSQIITISGTQLDPSKVDFTQFADVSGSFKETYARSSFNQSKRSFLAETAIENIGQFPTDVPLLVGITNISDPMILVRDADGQTPDGIPYYDFTGLVTGGTLAPRGKTGFLAAEFYNPNQTQFTYDLVFYGKLNEPPQINSLPPTEADLNREYRYDVVAIDPNHDAITFALVESPAGMTINSTNGQIRWTPVTPDVGLHTVDIRVSDSRLGVSTQRYTLSARPTPTNRVPVFTSFPIALADVGKAYPYTAQAVDADGDVLVYRLVAAPTGMTINAASGAIQWTPTPLQLGAQPVVIEVSDSRGGAAEQSFSLLVLSPADNAAPVIVSSAPTAIKLSGLSYQVIALDADREPLTYRLSNAPVGMTISPTGLINWTPTSAQFGPHVVGVEVLDTRGGRDAQSFTLAVFDNQDPVFTSQPITTAQLNVAYSYQVRVTDSVDDLLSFKLLDAPVGMTINASSGLVSWDVTKSAYEQEPVTIAVFDGRGGMASQRFVIAVTGGQSQAFNINPVFVSTPPTVASVGTEFAYHAQARDPDGDSLTYDLPLSPHGMVIGAATGQLGWLPQSNQAGMQQVVIRVKDGQGGIWLQSFQIDVDASNTAPVITTSPMTNASVGNPWEYRLHVQDSQNDPLMFELVPPVSGMTLTPLSNSDASAVLRFTPTVAGSVDVVLVAKDSRGGRIEQRFAVQVAASSANIAPIIHSVPRLTVPAGQTWVYLVSADDPNGDPITLSLPTAPTGMTLDAGLRLVSWTPTLSQLGTHAIVLSVADGRGGTVSQSVTLQVVSKSDNAAPSIVSPPSAFRATVGEPFKYDLKAADDDNDPVEWTLIEAPHGASMDRRYGTLRWTPTLDQLGLQRFIVSAKDPLGLEALQSFSLNVSGANLGPSILSRAPSEAVVDDRYVYGVRAIDPENDPLVYALKSGPTGMTIDVGRGIIRWTPTLSQLGSANASVEVTDSRGNKSTQRFQINVTQVVRNQDPIITTRAIFRARVDALYQYDVNAIDPEGDAITYSLASAPSGMQIDSAGGLITWIPTDTQTGSHLVQVAAQDSAGGRSIQRFALLARINQAPVIISQAVTNVAIGETFHYDLQVIDPESDAISYELILGPTGMTIDSLGRVIWQTEPGVPAFDTVALRVTDSYGAFLSYVYGLTVTPDTTAPRVELRLSANPVALGQNAVVVIQASDNVGVVDVRLTMNGQPLVLDANHSITLRGDIAGLYALRATARDASGNEGTSNVSLRVFDPADTQGPSIRLTSPQPNAVVTTLTDIVGSITDDNLQFYRIDYGRADLVDVNHPEADDPDYKTLTTSNTAAVDAVLATFDPTMLINDDYVLRILAQDLSGNVTAKTLPISLDGQLKLGQITLDFIDLSIPVAGVPITVTRSYDTRNAGEQGDFGFGWTLSVSDPQIRESIPVNPLEAEGLFFAATPFREGTRVYLTNPEGRRVGFTFKPQGQFSIFGGGTFAPTFVPDKGVYDKLDVGTVGLRKINGAFYSGFFGDPFNPSAYRLTTKDGTVYEYGQFSGLDNIRDRNGNRIEIRPDGVFSSTGPAIEFLRDSQGRITQVIDPAGNPLNYTYDRDGNLATFEDQEHNTTRYTYLNQPAHFLDTIIDPRGITTFNAEFDASGRWVSSKDALGHSVLQSFNTYSSLYSTSDLNGNTTQFRYDALGNITEEIDALGNSKFIEYSDPNNPYLETKTVDRNGNATSYSFDEKGNLKQHVDAMGSSVGFAYDGNGNLTQVTDRLGRISLLTYDSSSNLMKHTDQNGNSTTFKYDASGRITERIDRNANPVRFEYLSSQLKPTRISYSDTAFQDYVYDSRGNRTRFTNELGEVTDAFFDKKGRQIRLLGPTGAETLNVYEGNLLVEQRDRIDATAFSISRLVYDDADQVVKRIDAEGSVTELEYDAKGNLRSVLDPSGNIVVYNFDALDRVVSQVDVLGNQTVAEYDDAGNAVALTDRNGARRQFEFDAVGRLIKESWLSNGQVTYDAAFSFDAEGKLLLARDNFSSLTFSYNNRNYVSSVGNHGSAFQPDLTLAFEYDAEGNQTLIHDNFGTEVKSKYDGRNQLQIRSWSGNEFSPVSVEFDRNAANESMETRRYDDRAQRTLVSTSHSNFDSRGKQIDLDYFDRTNTLFSSYSFDYDLSGRLLKETYNNNSTVYALDSIGQILSATHANSADEFFVYDDNGNRVESHANGNDYRYAAGNRLVSDGTLSYTYDSEGRLQRKTEIGTGNYVHYEYDYRGRLTDVVERTVEDVATSEVNYVYDVFDRLIYANRNGVESVYVHNGNSSWADFDSDGNVVTRYLFGLGTDEIIARHRPSEGIAWYLPDARGSIRDIVNNEGTVLNHIEYDTFGNVLSETDPTDRDRFKFEARELDGVTGLYNFRARHYDPVLGRFTTEDPLGTSAGETNAYVYARNQPTTFSDPTGLSPIATIPATQVNAILIVEGAIGAAFVTLACNSSASGIGIIQNELAGAASFYAFASIEGAILGIGAGVPLIARLSVLSFIAGGAPLMLTAGGVVVLGGGAVLVGVAVACVINHHGDLQSFIREATKPPEFWPPAPT